MFLQGRIGHPDVYVELDQRTGPSPYASFVVPVNAHAAAAPPTSVKIQVTASQCELGGESSRTIAKDLRQVV